MRPPHPSPLFSPPPGIRARTKFSSALLDMLLQADVEELEIGMVRIMLDVGRGRGVGCSWRLA